MEVGFIQFFAVLFGLILGNTGAPSAPAEPIAVIDVPHVTQQSFTTEASLGGPVAIDDLATCLTENDAKFYGAYWCSHCSEQKERFGTSLKNIQYIECDERGPNGNSQACLDAEITAYPTWKIPGNTDLIGGQTHEKLAAWSGCPYQSQ